MNSEGRQVKKITILLTSSTGFNNKDGISTILYDYCSRFNMDEFELHLVVSGKYRYDTIENFKRIGVMLHFLPSRKKQLLQYFWHLLRLISKEKIDLIYAHGSSTLLSIELLAAMISGCRCRVVHSHNTKCDHTRLNSILRPVFNCLYTEAVACGEDAGKWLFGEHSFRIIRNGRDLNQYRYREEVRSMMRSQLDLENDCLAIGHVGGFNRQKNQEYLVHVFNEVVKDKPNSKLFFIGEGNLKTQIQEVVEVLGLSEQVIFMGAISNVQEVLQAMDVMVLPSLYEGLPLVVVEWQIAALPSIISDNVTRECVFSNLVHYMSLESEYESWAKKVLKISENNRTVEAEAVIELAKKSGFDIDMDAIELQRYFKQVVKRK